MILLHVREAFTIFAANRVRTILTTLTLAVGVATVIAIQTLGAGLAGAMGGVLGFLNDSSFFVVPNTKQANMFRAALRIHDLELLTRSLPNIAAALPAGATSRIVAVDHHRVRLAVGCDGDQRFYATPIALGRGFNGDDINGSAHVALLTAKAAQRLFPGASAVGRSIRIGEHRYVVIGTAAPAKTGMMPNFVFGDVTVPSSTYEREFLTDGRIFAARLIVADNRSIAETESAVLEALRVRKGERVEYRTFDRQGISRTIDGIYGGETLVVGLLGALSLVVAGIGILNIMLVSVAERRREVGVRRAIGATRMQILAQFFTEALMLAACGCAVGLIVGLGIGYLVNTFALVLISGVVTPIPWLHAVMLATAFAVILAVFFGTYPAYCATNVDPIEALRHD
jgi:ABC-type antimicrobial peptide transport system permease subunit